MRTKFRKITALAALTAIFVTSLMSSLDAAAIMISTEDETTTLTTELIVTSQQVLPTQQLCAEEAHFSDCYLCGKMADSSRIYDECCAGLLQIVQFCRHLVHSEPPPTVLPLPPPLPDSVTAEHRGRDDGPVATN